VRARVAASLLVAGALSFGAASASGHPDRRSGDVSGRDAAGDVDAAGLTAAERAAIDIVSVRSTGREGLGVLVTATFRGNFAALFGRGHLKNAAAALVLKGKDGGSAGVVSFGPGPEGTIARRSRSTEVAAVRHGRQLTFLIAGPGWGNVASARVEVILDPPPLGAGAPAGRAIWAPSHIADQAWLKFLEKVAADRVIFGDASPLSLTPRGLRALLARIDEQALALEELELEYGSDAELRYELDSLSALRFQTVLTMAARGSAAPAGPCECADIGVIARFAHGHVTNPRGPVHLKLFMNWTMTCTTGSGACSGQITVLPSGDLKIVGPPGGSATCTGKAGCPQQSKGRFTVSMISDKDLHDVPRNVPITVKIYCRSGKSLVAVRTTRMLLHFDANGFVEAAKSDLKA
jgi:hypothetical protein